MKKLIALLLILVVAVLPTACDSSEKIPDIIYIKGTPYSTTMTKLSLHSLKITNEDLEPLRYMTNLEKLNIGDNAIDDISVLSELTNLDMLRMHQNNVSNLSALSGLTNLRELWLFDNPVSEEQIAELQAALPDCVIVNVPVRRGER